MRDKIINALATRYSNLGVGRKALDGVAAFLEKTVASEDDIDNAVAGSEVLALLKAIQGESDSLRTANAQMKKRLEGLEDKEQPKDITPKPDEGQNGVEKMLRELLDKQTALEARMTAGETRRRNEDMLRDAEAIMVAAGADNAFIRGISMKGLTVGEDDTASSLAERGKAAYDDNFKQAFGTGPLPPSGKGGNASGYRKGMYAEVVKRLESSGRLEQKAE